MMKMTFFQKIAVFGLRIIKGRTAGKKMKALAKNNCRTNEVTFGSLKGMLYEDRYITDQRSLKDMRLGKSDIGYAGCEIIAVYNALQLAGSEADLCNLINFAERSGMLVRSGKWGTNPYRLNELAEIYGAELEPLSGHFSVSLAEPGIYILSFWNSKKLMDGVHTVCVHIAENDIAVYNMTYPGAPYVVERVSGNALFDSKHKPAVISYRLKKDRRW